jgi:hypothetical protein
MFARFTLALGIWTYVTTMRRADKKPKESKQFLLGDALVWLVLVPLAHPMVLWMASFFRCFFFMPFCFFSMLTFSHNLMEL